MNGKEKNTNKINSVTRIGELGTTLALTSNRSKFLLSVLRSLVTANIVPRSPILFILITKGIYSSEKWVLTRATRRNIQPDGIHHNPKGSDDGVQHSWCLDTSIALYLNSRKHNVSQMHLFPPSAEMETHAQLGTLERGYLFLRCRSECFSNSPGDGNRSSFRNVVFSGL
jgi:hypothetical protein